MCECCGWEYTEYSFVNWWVLEVFPDGRESFFSEKKRDFYSNEPFKGYRTFDQHHPSKLVLTAQDPEWINRWYDYKTSEYQQLLDRKDRRVTGLTVPVRYVQGAPILHRARPTHTWYHVDQLTHEFLERQRDGFRIA